LTTVQHPPCPCSSPGDMPQDDDRHRYRETASIAGLARLPPRHDDPRSFLACPTVLRPAELQSDPAGSVGATCEPCARAHPNSATTLLWMWSGQRRMIRHRSDKARYPSATDLPLSIFPSRWLQCQRLGPPSALAMLDSTPSRAA
jgi:hypothetical protein